MFKKASYSQIEWIRLPHRITGHEKCPRVDRKSGKHCNKLGRLNPNPMISWNNSRGYDVKCNKKRAYMQFIHNDGTRHNICTYEKHWLTQLKGHPFEKLLIRLNTLSNVNHGISDFLNKVAEDSQTWGLKPEEQKYIVNSLKQGNFKPLIKEYEGQQRKNRREIYKQSLTANDDKYRSYGSIEYNRLDQIARALMDSDKHTIESELDKLQPQERPIVIERVIELIDVHMKRLNDHRDIQIGLLKEVAEQKGYALPFSVGPKHIR